MSGSNATTRKPMVLHARMLNGTGGGPDKTIINSPRFLDSLGYECICAFYRPANDPGFSAIRKRANEANANILEIDDGGIFDLSMIKKTIKVCREKQVDIWHGHDYKTNLLGWIVSKFHSMRLITTAHGWVDFSGRLPTYYRYEKRWILPRYETVICVSSTVMEQAIAGGTPASKCVLIENAIDHEQFSRRREISDAKLADHGVPSDKILIGSIGRLSQEKGFDLLIDAVAELINQGLNLQLVIAGEGPEKENLQSQIEQLGMAEQIKLPGFCQDTRSFYETLDLFVLSSHREGLPNVVLEAMAVGAPVLATAVDGVPRIITDGQDGRLIPAGSTQKIRDAIADLITQPERLASLAQQGTKTIKEKWSFQKRMERVAKIYAADSPPKDVV